MRVHHWQGVDDDGTVTLRNFGDELQPYVLRTLGRQVDDASRAEAEVFAGGSIAQLVPKDREVTLWGTGLLFDHGFKAPSCWDVRAVRGPLTAKALGLDDVAFGDPGLLAERVAGDAGLLWDMEPDRLGLVVMPHFTHFEAVTDAVAGAGLLDGPHPVTIVDPRWDILRVLSTFASAQAVLSSGLHGLITADSFGIPSARLVVDDRSLISTFKYQDHDAAVEIDRPEYGLAELVKNRTATTLAVPSREHVHRLAEDLAYLAPEDP